MQNANDLGAREVRLLLRDDELLVAHNGLPVELPHVLALATPWLTTKSNDPSANGRFGIGLMTLRALSRILEVHCAPYHARLGDPTVTGTDPFTVPAGFAGDGWTVLRIPLEPGALSEEQLTKWLDLWDDSSLLFCRHVSIVSLLASNGTVLRRLSLKWHDDASTSSDGRRAIASDGRSWLVYAREIESPVGLGRAHKATGSTTPIGVALSLLPCERGQIYTGLPVVWTRLAVWVNAQFDPLASRQDLASTQWNAELVPLVADVWLDAVVDLFERDPKAGWASVPIPEDGEPGRAPSTVSSLEAQLLARARGELPTRLAFKVPGHGTVALGNLAVEVAGLEGVLSFEEIARLAGTNATLPRSARDDDGRWRTVLKNWRDAGAALLPPVDFFRALPLLGDESRSAASTIALASATIDEGLGSLLATSRCVVAENGSHVTPPGREEPSALVDEPKSQSTAMGLQGLGHPQRLATPSTGPGRAPPRLLLLRSCGDLQPPA